METKNQKMQRVRFRERSLFMGGGAVQIRGGGINFSASKLKGGKFSVQALEGGGAKFQCTDI